MVLTTERLEVRKWGSGDVLLDLPLRDIASVKTRMVSQLALVDRAGQEYYVNLQFTGRPWVQAITAAIAASGDATG